MTTSAPWWYEIGRVDPLHPAVRATNRAVRALAVLTILLVALGGTAAWSSDRHYNASMQTARGELAQAQAEQAAARTRLTDLSAETRTLLSAIDGQVDRPAVVPAATEALTAATSTLAEPPDSTPVRSVTLPTLTAGARRAQAHRDRLNEASQALGAQLLSLQVSHAAWVRSHAAPR